MFEKVYSFVLGEEVDIDLRGEFVLVIEGFIGEENALEGLSLKQQVGFYLKAGLSQKEAIKAVAKANKIKNIYKVLEENN